MTTVHAVASPVKCGCGKTIPLRQAYRVGTPVAGIRPRTGRCCDKTLGDVPDRRIRIARKVIEVPPGSTVFPGADLSSLEARLQAEARLRRTPRRELAVAGPRGNVVSGRTRFLVSATGAGDVKVSIEGLDGSEEVLKAVDLKESALKTCYGYVERHLGTRDQVGNKGGGLYNRVREALGVWKPKKPERKGIVKLKKPGRARRR